MTDQRCGQFKIYMGYAAGVGKTYKMLEDAQGLKARQQDVVIGYFEPHGRRETIAKAEGLEVVPRKKLDYRGATFEEMDTEAILARRPQICLIDELPHTNVPGTRHAKRWEDVVELLDAGLDVLTNMNIQHLESLNDQIRDITGVTVRETVPDWVVQRADEVLMVDLTPRALLHRLERGVIYERQQAQLALQNFFREPTLVALRELALREAAHEVEQRIAGTQGGPGEGLDLGRQSQKQQKILVYLTADPKTSMVTRRAKRVSDFLDTECFAVAVLPSKRRRNLTDPHREAIEKQLDFARNLHIDTRILEGRDAASLLIDFARQNQVTQIFVTRPRNSLWPPLLSTDPVHKVIRLAKDMQIVIVSDRDPLKRR